jgi:hypothetical protein
MRRRRGQRERHSSIRLGDGRDPSRGPADHRVVERSDLGEHRERVERRGRLARRGTDVRLERVAEPAVRVAVGPKRVEDM